MEHPVSVLGVGFFRWVKWDCGLGHNVVPERKPEGHGCSPFCQRPPGFCGKTLSSQVDRAAGAPDFLAHQVSGCLRNWQWTGWDRQPLEHLSRQGASTPRSPASTPNESARLDNTHTLWQTTSFPMNVSMGRSKPSSLPQNTRRSKVHVKCQRHRRSLRRPPGRSKFTTVFHLLKNMSCFPFLVLKRSLSLLEICVFFPGVLTKWKLFKRPFVRR